MQVKLTELACPLGAKLVDVDEKESHGMKLKLIFNMLSRNIT